MEPEFDCSSSSNNGNDTPSSWIQPMLSDLEENTKSMLSLLKLEDGDSLETCAEMYSKNKPELEKQIEQFQKLYHLLLDKYTPILSPFLFSSMSTANQLEITSDFNPQSLNNSSNSTTETCLDDQDSDAQLQNTKKMIKISHEALEEKISTSDRHYESFSFPSTQKPVKNESTNLDMDLSVEDIDPEILEKNISKLSDMSPIRGQSVFERWVEFEKRVSTSEVLELVEDSKTQMDELLRRYEETKTRIEVLMKENQLLRDENLKLMSENELLISMIQDRVKEKRGSKFSSSCYITSVIKNSFSRLKAHCKNMCT